MAVDFQYNIFSMESSISVAIGKLIDSYEHTLDTPGMPSIHPSIHPWESWFHSFVQMKVRGMEDQIGIHMKSSRPILYSRV